MKQPTPQEMLEHFERFGHQWRPNWPWFKLAYQDPDWWKDSPTEGPVPSDVMPVLTYEKSRGEIARGAKPIRGTLIKCNDIAIVFIGDDGRYLKFPKVADAPVAG